MMEDLIARLPEHLQQSPEVKAIQDAIQEEVLQLRADTEETILQLFVAYATNGLDRWDESIALTVDHSKSYIDRRNRILSKLRGQGTSTVELIRTIVSSFGFSSIEVLEHSADYQFEIVFLGIADLPENLLDITTAIHEIKPAHLGFWFTFQAEPFHVDILSGGYLWAVTETTLPHL